MPRKVVERVIVYKAWSGDVEPGGCSYTNGAQYDDFDELVMDMKAALDVGLQVMIEPGEMSESEYNDNGKSFAAGVNPLIGSRT